MEKADDYHFFIKHTYLPLMMDMAIKLMSHF